MKNKTKKILLSLIIISTFLMSVGYATINSISLDVSGDLIAKAQDGVFITEVNYVSNSDANITDSEIIGFSKTTLNSKVVLSDVSETSSITYKVKIYNGNDTSYKFKGSVYDESFYSNSNIDFTLNNISEGDIVDAKNYIEFEITFHYKNYQLSTDNTLTSYINFNFVLNKSIMENEIVDKYVSEGETIESIDLDNLTDSEKSNMFSNAASGQDIYKVKGIGGDDVTIFRGTYTDNYVSFGGLLWRILQIDSDGNLRLILDDVISTTSSYKSSSSATSEDDAKTVLSYSNSNIKTIVDNWYTNNLSSYSSNIVTSKFCADFTSYTRTSSGTQASVYYFQSYENLGQDSANYNPNLNCPSEYIFEDNIGLISAEEVVLAGGAFGKENTSFFLYNSSITNYYWTLSPAYYDPNQQNANVFIVSSKGVITDWTSGLLTNSYNIRPVITINGNISMTGDGTKSNPYTYSN